MSRKFSIGNVASRSCLAARGASTRRAELPGLPDHLGFAPLQPERHGSKMGASGVMLMPTSNQLVGAGENLPQEIQDSSIERSRCLQVRQMADARQADITAARYLGRHALDHRRRRVGIFLAREAEHGNAQCSPGSPLVERHQAAHGGAIGVGRHRAHHLDRQRTPRGLRRQPHHALDELGREIGHGLAGIERADPVRDELLLEVAVGAAECRAGAGQHRGAVAIRPPAQRRLHHHAAHRMPDAGWAAQAALHRSPPPHQQPVRRSPLPQPEIARRSPANRAPPARNRPRQSLYLRRPDPRRAADAMDEDDRRGLANAMRTSDSLGSKGMPILGQAC